MPRHRTHHSTMTCFFPQEFPQHAVRFKEESRQSWAELMRRFGTHSHTARRWRNAGVCPSTKHMMVLLDLADERSLSHLLAVRHGITKTLYPVHRLNAPDDAVDCFTFRITEPRFATQGTRQLDRDASITLATTGL